MATPGPSRRPVGNKKEQQDPQIKSNLSGLKHQLHGASYQVKLGIVVSLANARKSMDPNNNFTFTVMAEGRDDSEAKSRDRVPDKFDDIVYEFRDGTKTGVLKIQAKHKLSKQNDKPEESSANQGKSGEKLTRKDNISPKLTLVEFIPAKQGNEQKKTNTNTQKKQKDTFAVDEYYGSFQEQQKGHSQQKTTGIEGYILCTNAVLDDDTTVMWNEIDKAFPGDSTISLDPYTTSLFNKAGGKCYRLKTHYKRAALARLLINAIKSKEQMVTWQRPLFKEYRAAILDIIDCGSSAQNGTLFSFTANFLDSSASNSNPGYEAFQKEFEDQFRQDFELNETAWKYFKKNIQIHVSGNFLLDEKNPYSSSDKFPDDNVDESFKSFCDQFRLVCGTYNEHGLDDAIVEIWRNWHVDDTQLVSNRLQECVAENVVTEKLFKTYYDWLKDPVAKPLHSQNIRKGLENIEGTLAYMKLNPISDTLRKNVVASPFRISQDVLKTSDLYKQVQIKYLLQVEAFDIQFAATVLLDTLDCHCKDRSATTLFLNESDFITNSDTVKAVLRCVELPPCLIIICHEKFKDVQGIVQKWEEHILKNSAKHVFLIRKTSNISSDLRGFHICGLTEQSRTQFFAETIPLCTTTIPPSKIFQNNFEELPIEEVIKLLNWGKEMEESTEIAKKYHEIKTTYVNRPWVDSESNLKAGNIEWKKDAPILKNIKEPHEEGMSIKEITNGLKKDSNFKQMFENANNPEEEHETIVGGGAKKVLILLGEAGLGKSTNLTWMAWHLRKQNPSCWVVRCNLSDHCTSFKAFVQHPNNAAGKVIDETEALRMLYKLVCSSLQLPQAMAETCSKCLVFSDGEAILKEDFMEGLSLNNSIQLLVFKEKFNAGKLMLLLDGFDEIAPNYKEVVLNLLSHYELFKGVEKCYLTCRPYGFREQFEKTFINPSFFKLKPLSLYDKGSILFKFIKVKWDTENIVDEEILTDFYKSLCFMLLCSLGDMSDVPLNLMMAVDILGERVYHNGNIITKFTSKTYSRELLEGILKLSKTSFIVEEFVKVKIRHLLYDKNGTDKNVADKPLEIIKFDKAIGEAKLLHGLVALWVLFNKNERHIILSANETRVGEDYLQKIHEGCEKTGIIHASPNGGISFIHRTFAEYLAAWWIVKRRIEGKQRGGLKITTRELFWKREELSVNIDTILAKHHPLHLSIIEKDWKTVESLLSTNPKSLYERNDGNRSPFHLIALYYDFEEDWPQFLPDSIESRIMNTKDKLFGWTALDYAFYRDKPQLICYLLNYGALINVKVLFEQIVSAEKDKIQKAATYARYVMGYLSSSGIEYESHDACKKMKQFCDKVVAYFDIETSGNSEPMQDNKIGKNYDGSGKQMVKDTIAEDSAWMLESIIQRRAGRKLFVRLIRNSYFNLESETESIFVVKYFMEKDPSILNNENLWDCIVLSVHKNYTDGFKYFFDLYCSRIKIKEFQPCLIQRDSIDFSIQSDEASSLIDYVENNVKNLVCDFRNNLCWSKLGIPAEIMIDKNILSLLIICVAAGKPSMLRYLIESCKMNLCAGIVYCLAMTCFKLFSKIPHQRAIKPNQAFECLLDLASNISDDEANKMLRLALTSQLFEFSKCLIERFKIDFQAGDETKGWNVFHLCASNQRSIFVGNLAADDTRAPYVDGDRTDLFRYMLAKEKDMDCFGIIDERGPSILRLAMENGQRGIVEHIVARKLGLNEISKITNLSVDAIPNISFCYRAIYEISKSIGEQLWHYKLICILAKQIAKISLNNAEKSQEPRSGRLVLQEDAKELYQIAIKCKSLFLMYYLHREFPGNIPSLIYDEDWLACIARSLNSSDFLDVTKWLLNPNEVNNRDNLYEVVEECDDEGYDFTSVDLKQLIRQVQAIVSANRFAVEGCKLKLLTLAMCLKRESMIRHLCEILNLNIDWKVLIEITRTAHRSYLYDPGSKIKDGCAFENPDFISIYKYLFERTTNLGEIDAEGRNVLHLAAQSGLGCMAKFLIKHNMVNVMTTNEHNGWNIFHYYSSGERWRCCDTKNDELLKCITKRVLEITSDGFPLSSLTESRKNKLKELCFNNNEGGKSVIHVAVVSGNYYASEYIVSCRLGISRINDHEIKNSDECSRFRECYDELSQIATQLPFNAWYDYLLHKLAKSIHRFSPENIEHITGQEDVEDHIVEDACQSTIKYRSLISLEHLFNECEDQMNQALGRSTSNELVSCMMECIRQNRTSMLKVLVGHYRTLQDIQRRVEVEFEVEENESIDDATIAERKIQWPIINEFTENVAMNRDYLHLFILSVAYGRLSMTRYLVEMLHLEIKKSLIVLIMKMLKDLWDQNCKAAMPVYEYLANRCEGKPNLLLLCTQAGCWTMLKYLIKERKLDPNEIDSENGWNVGHYYVSEPNFDSGYEEFTWLVDQYNMDCFGVYDRKGRNIFHLALENDRTREVKYIINHRLGLIGDKQPWYVWDSEKIEKLINELQQTIKSLPENMPPQKPQILHDVLETVDFYLVNRTSANIVQIFNTDCKNNNEQNETKNTQDVIGGDSVKVKDRVNQKEVNEKLFYELIRNSYFDLALKSRSISVVAYFVANDPFFLPEKYLWKCAVYGSLKNYNIEFKYFFDLYCSRFKIKDFQPCSIQTNKAYYVIDYSNSDEIQEVCDRINNICLSKLGMPTEIRIDENILSLLLICVATVRPSMLRYLIESCKLNLCASIVYSLAMITDHLFSKIPRDGALKPKKAYECLLDLASNISDDEANKMLRHALTSQLYEFSKCLIELFKIDLEAVDETKGWNIFHLCASNQRSTFNQETPNDNNRANDGNTDFFRYMLAKETDMDCFGVIDKNGRSVLHLAMENGQRGIVEHIVARKVGLNNFYEIQCIESVDAIPNIRFCYLAIYEISKSIGEQLWHYKLICMLAQQIAKISLNNGEESQEPRSGRLLLQEDATELHQIATKGRSLFLMCYLQREFPSMVPPLIYDGDWLAYTASNLYSPDFIDATNWLLNPNEVDKHDNLYEVVVECDVKACNFMSVNLEELVKQVEEKLSVNRSLQEQVKMKLFALAVCLKREPMIRHLCETLNINIDWKVLIDIMVIAHGSYVYDHGSKIIDGCAFENPDFIPIYKYLFERTTNLGEIDAEGRNVLHLASQYGLGCMAKFLIKHNMFNVMTSSQHNGWNVFHYYASRKTFWRCCDTDNDTLLACMIKRELEITSADIPLSCLTENRKNKLKELFFNSDDGVKSVIHIAVEADNISTAAYIIECRLGIAQIGEHKIRNSDECSRFRECYDELSQMATQLPFNKEYDYLLHKLAKSIHRFSPENIEHITGQEDVEDHIVEDACRSAIKYRSLITLEYLMIAYEGQISKILARSTRRELVVCMMECIRGNRSGMLKVFVGHYRTLCNNRTHLQPPSSSTR